jgi:glycosyltransferase involved in cell wall biosynthesis
MKILFDHQIFSSQVYGGVSKYFAEVITRLPAENWEISAWLSNNEYVKFHHLFKATSFFPQINFRGKGRIMSELGKPYSIYKMLQGKYDVVHQTNFDTYLIKAIGTKPMVTTYHDINFLTEQNYQPRMVELQKKSLERADAVIAISENTKRDMLRYFDIDEKKISVVYHGIDIPVIPSQFDDRVVQVPYILFVGMRHLFKNFKNFIKAFATVSKKYPEVHIVCTRQDFSSEELALFHSLGIESKMKVIKADEVTLNRLYRDALFFIFPSKYEGFGMPILEAMINKCPVALANSSCFPEIAGNAGIYFNPNEIDSIAEIIEKFLDSQTLREIYAQKGYERALKFTWQETSNRHFEIYKSLM